MENRPSTLDFLKELYRIWITDRPNQLAAALAYYGIFSFAPVIYIAVTVVGIFIKGLSVAELDFSRVEELLGPQAAQTISNALSNISIDTSSSSVIASLISFLALFFAASGLFFQVQFALNTLWKVPPPQKGQTLAFLKQRLFSFLMVIAVSLLLLVVVVVGFVISWLNSVINLDASLPVINLAAFIALAMISLALIYKFVPDTPVAWRDVWLGAAVTTLLITLGGLLVVTFLGSSHMSSALEAAGSFAVILIGIYYVAQIFLFGAVFTKVYATTFGSKRELDVPE